MNIDKKTIIAFACSFVLAMGLVVILVIATVPMASHFSLRIQRSYSVFIFFFCLLVVVPLVSQRLNRLPDIKKILGWTFIGLGAEFLIFPVTILFLVLGSPSIMALLLGGMTFVLSAVFGIPASLISFIMGISLIKSKI
jgi:predicted ABC-type exoprotein transport system permease subunit